MSQGTRTIYNFFVFILFPTGAVQIIIISIIRPILFLFQVFFLLNFFIFFSCLPMVFHLISHSASTGGHFFYPVVFVVRRHVVSCFLQLVSFPIALLPFLSFFISFHCAMNEVRLLFLCLLILYVIENLN